MLFRLISRLRSIRWRLPVSYAGIALLTALASGLALLLPLRGYYQERERAYLERNARAIASGVAPLMEYNQLQPANLTNHIELLAFLSQARVRLLHEDGQVMADSGQPDLHNPVQIAAFEAPVGVNGLIQGGLTGGESLSPEAGGQLIFKLQSNGYPPAGIAIRGMGAIPVQSVTGVPDPGPQVSTAGGDGDPNTLRFYYTEAIPAQPGQVDVTTAAPAGLASVIPVSSSMYGFALLADPEQDDARSDQVHRQPVTGAGNRLLGWVELSGGPAYGRTIVASVARAWLLASLIAVGVAASTGWWISQRMIGPLLALTAVTQRMAAGDLAVRASSASQPDEFGSLGAAFNEMAARTERTVRTLRRFASDAAHEIQTPITALHTNLELATGSHSHASGPDQGEYLQRAGQQLQRLEVLASDLLDLSRLEAGMLDDQRAPLDLAKLIEKSGEALASQAEQAGILFTLTVPEEPVAVCGQGDQLRRLVTNLAENAIKFTPAGGEVQLGLAATGSQACLWVEDNGIGITPEDLPDLFSRFHRGRNAAGYPGSGLGLSIVQVIVEHHHGQVEVESGSGRTRFSVFLPLLE